MLINATLGARMALAVAVRAEQTTFQGNFGQDRRVARRRTGRSEFSFRFVIYVSNKAHRLTVKETTSSVFLKCKLRNSPCLRTSTHTSFLPTSILKLYAKAAKMNERARVTHYPAVKKALAISCKRHHQTRIFRNFSARHVVNARFRAPFHYRLIKKRFVAADRRTREGARGFGVPDTPAGLRSYATRLGKRVCQNAFFHFCPHGLATDCNCRATAILPYIPPLHTRHLLPHFHCIVRVSIISVGGKYRKSLSL